MQKIFWSIPFLAFSLAFCMEEIPSVNIIQNIINEANTAISKGEKNKGLELYAQIANTYFPSPGYTEQRKLKQQAVAFINQEAKKLIDQGDYKEALKVYSYAQRTFFKEIEALQKLIPFQDQIQPAIQLKKFEDIYKIFDRAELKDIPEIAYWKVYIKEQEKDYYYNKAQEAQNRGDKQKEREWLGKIVDMDLPHTREYLHLRRYRDEILNDMKSEALKLESEGKYDDALAIYNFAPRMFQFEKRHIEAIKNFNKAMQDKNFQEALKILESPELFFSTYKNLKPSIELQYYLQKARELGEDKEAWKWYAQATKVSLPDAPSSGTDPYEDVRQFKKEAMNKVSEVVTNLKNQGAYDEILKLYNYSPQKFAAEIEALQKYLPFQKEIQQAVLLKNQKNFEGALAILDKAGIKNLPDVVKLKMNIQNEKRKLEQTAKSSEQGPQEALDAPKIKKKWLFIKSMPGAQDQEDPDADWRIKGQELQLNIDATEAITMESFAELIKKAEDGPLPFILVMAESEDIPDPKKPTQKPKKYTHFFDGTVINRFMTSLKKTGEKLGLSRAYIQDPLNRQKVINIEIYVMGNDGKLHLLQDKADINYLNQFVKEKPDTKELIGGTYVLFYNYVLQPALTAPGAAQIFIANLFKQKANKLYGKEEEVALQYAKQWYDWALMPALQNLTHCLRHVAIKLYRL